ncbi:MAG TPA: rRNA adenine N-6-methyltransferase family protein, partial [Casimicrobiaceae bacterium]
MTRFDYEQARFNMIEQQIRPWDVLDTRVLDLLFAVHREDFVPQAYRTLALADLELPLGNGYRMWTPKMEARVLQELRVQPSERVLEIGTGSGYLTALLASEAGDVTSVEIDAATAADARAKLARHGFTNVRIDIGDGARGYGNEIFDVI